MINRNDLVADLNRIGVQSGDRVLVHTSLRAVGPVEGGADTVLDALLGVVGEHGLLVVPTFTYSYRRFDPRIEPGATGRLPETLRTRPEAVRSWHPTHSVAAIGSGASDLCRDHHLLSGLAVSSPLDRLAKQAGKVLLIGVGHTANSTVHLGESYAELPFLDTPFEPNEIRTASVVTDSEELFLTLKNPPGCSRAFGGIEQSLRLRGAIRDGRIGHATAQLMSGQDVINAAIELLRRDVGALLCTNPDCYRCVESRRRLDA